MSEGDATKTCPHCGETILAAAKKCRFCRQYLDDELAAENASLAWNRMTAPPSAGDRMLMPVGRPISAIIAGYCGLLAFFPLIGIIFGVAGVACGATALKTIGDDPELSGKGRAWFGIVAGGVLAFAWCVLLAMLLIEGARR